MNALDFWRQKLVQLLHDPPAKAFFLRGGSGGHKVVARTLFESIAGVPLRYVRPAPDRAAAGADRPVVSPATRTKGVSPIRVDWVAHPVLTHPLASGERGPHAIHFGGVERPRTHAQTQALVKEVGATLDQMLERHEESEEEIEGSSDEDREHKALENEARLARLPIWNDDRALREVCWQLWRRWPTSAPPDLVGTLWEHQPADSRAPDHSLWDHLRVTSALAFLGTRKRDGATMPWLLAFSLGPVQRFIAQSRTSSDLWTTSMLLSDLIWHAMVPFVDRYGPEVIVYPDLRGNPRADLWLWEHREQEGWKNVLSPDANPCSYAGIFPNTFVALVPRGGEGGFDRLEVVAEAARQRVRDRWNQLAALAKQYFLDQAKNRGESLTAAESIAFERTWERQHKAVLFTAWSAAAWPDVEPVDDPESLAIREALPAQAPPPVLSASDDKALRDWRARHAPWIPSDAFAKYAAARHVYAKTNNIIHQSERGFDYPLIHHALQVRHALRKAEAQGVGIAEEAGEKCTLCGHRQALGFPDGSEGGHVDSQRAALRTFWRRFDRNSEGGAERLCAVCTMKRVLIRAGVERSTEGDPRTAGLTAAWAGPATPIDEVLDDDNELRAPFPSMATVVTQAYLCAVATHPDLHGEVGEVVRCCRAAQLPRTTFVRALRSLAEAALRADSTGRELLEYEAEMTVFPEVIASAERRTKTRPDDNDVRDRHGKPIEEAKLRELRIAVAKLRNAAAQLGRRAAKQASRTVPVPGAQAALIALDGDGVRKLLLGKEVGARWRDVIHPNAVQAMMDNDKTREAGWPDLLDHARLMGPSTHAFVNRVLASFAHTIVPWVVEREFSGRLIYAGGDDVLALAPAGEALDIAARLAQFYSAAWVIDTQPGEEPWGWRQRNASLSQSPSAADRFVVVAPGDDHLPWPIPAERTHAPVAQWLESGVLGSGASATGHLLPMMGAGQTLSAGIAIGHYKTSLGALVKAAWEERDRAKGKDSEGRETGSSTARNAFSIRRFTRGGEKARLRLAWGERGGRPEQALAGYVRTKRVIAGFRTGELPGRVPYKLREVEEAVIAAWSSEQEAPRSETGHASDNAEDARRKAVSRVKTFAEGLFATQVSASKEIRDAAFELWWNGLRGALRIGEKAARPTEDGQDGQDQWRGLGSEQGLSVCRFLGALPGGEEEDR